MPAREITAARDKESLSLPFVPRMTDYEKDHFRADGFLAPLGWGGVCQELRTTLKLKRDGKEVLRLPENRRTFHGLAPRSACSAAMQQA